MSDRSTRHDSFVIDRIFPVPVQRVYEAWAQRDAKERWFKGPNEWTLLEREFDFRIGGRETLVGKWLDGRTSAFECRYSDIVPNERIIYSYEMRMNDVLISVSLATVTLRPTREGTRFKFCEQAAYLDAFDEAGSRERGTAALLDN